LLTLWLILILHEFRPKLIAANYYFCANLEQNFEDLTQRKTLPVFENVSETAQI
jgi:hypothetical protein